MTMNQRIDLILTIVAGAVTALPVILAIFAWVAKRFVTPGKKRDALAMVLEATATAQRSLEERVRQLKANGEWNAQHMAQVVAQAKGFVAEVAGPELKILAGKSGKTTDQILDTLHKAIFEDTVAARPSIPPTASGTTTPRILE